MLKRRRRPTGSPCELRKKEGLVVVVADEVGLYVAIADVADYLLIFVGISGRALASLCAFLAKMEIGRAHV